MLDKALLAHAIGFAYDKNTVTPMELGNELKISQYRALQILEQLEDCCLIFKFDGFFAINENAEAN